MKSFRSLFLSFSHRLVFLFFVKIKYHISATLSSSHILSIKAYFVGRFSISIFQFILFSRSFLSVQLSIFWHRMHYRVTLQMTQEKWQQTNKYWILFAQHKIAATATNTHTHNMPTLYSITFLSFRVAYEQQALMFRSKYFPSNEKLYRIEWNK